MEPISRSELLEVISANPMICTRSIVKRLRPEVMADPDSYRETVHSI